MTLTTVTGTLGDETATLEWRDGVVDGTRPALGLLEPPAVSSAEGLSGLRSTSRT
jgi:hypothetical protein